MADDFCFSLLNATTLQLLQAAGFDAGHTNAIKVLTNLFEEYIELLSSTASAYSHLSSRSTGNIFDILDTLKEFNIDLRNLNYWLNSEANALSPIWTEQGDPSRTLKGNSYTNLIY